MKNKNISKTIALTVALGLPILSPAAFAAPSDAGSDAPVINKLVIKTEGKKQIATGFAVDRNDKINILYTNSKGQGRNALVPVKWIDKKNGKFYVILPGGVKDGAKVTVRQKNRDVFVVEHFDATPPAAPSDLNATVSELTGKTETGATLKISYTGVDGKKHVVSKANVTVKEDGSFVASFDPKLKPGTKASVEAMDATGNVGPAAETDTIKAPEVSKPVVKEITKDMVSGTAEGAKKVKITYTDAEKKLHTIEAEVAENGSFKASFDPAAAPKTKVSLVAVGEFDNESEPFEKDVPEKEATSHVSDPAVGAGSVSSGVDKQKVPNSNLVAKANQTGLAKTGSNSTGLLVGGVALILAGAGVLGIKRKQS